MSWWNPFSKEAETVPVTENITLMDGRVVNVGRIAFNPDTYHFIYAGGEDVTDEIYRRDKMVLVPNFDTQKDNLRVSKEKGVGQREGKRYNEEAPTSTWDVFVDQVTTNPLGAPLETLDHGVHQIGKSSGVQTIVLLSILGVVAYVWLQKKL